MRSKLWVLSLGVLVLVGVGVGLLSPAAAGESPAAPPGVDSQGPGELLGVEPPANFCLTDNFDFVFALTTLGPIPIAFGSLDVGQDSLWEAKGGASDTIVFLQTTNPDVDSDECCQIKFSGTGSGGTYTGVAENDTGVCNTEQGCSGRSFAWTASKTVCP